MSERTGGARAVLSIPRFYAGLQRLVGSGSSHRRFIDEHLRPRSGARVLDIGCGPGEVLPLLGNVRYLGFDLNPCYPLKRVLGQFEGAGLGIKRCFTVPEDPWHHFFVAQPGQPGDLDQGLRSPRG